MRIHLIATLVALLSAGNVRAQDVDQTQKKLDAALESYDSSVDDAAQHLLKSLDIERDSAQRRGALDTLQTIDSEIEAFKSDFELPKSVSTKAYERSTQRAIVRLQAAYENAIRDYTKSDNIPLATQLQKELDDLRKNGRRNTAEFYPSGKWVLNYSPGPCIATILITRDRKALFKDNLRRTRNGEVISEKGQLVIRYEDFIEVWKLDAEGKEISVGHYHPASRFPAKNPSHTAKLRVSSSATQN